MWGKIKNDRDYRTASCGKPAGPDWCDNARFAIENEQTDQDPAPSRIEGPWFWSQVPKPLHKSRAKGHPRFFVREIHKG
jgi:hypothetical protein